MRSTECSSLCLCQRAQVPAVGQHRPAQGLLPRLLKERWGKAQARLRLEESAHAAETVLSAVAYSC